MARQSVTQHLGILENVSEWKPGTGWEHVRADDERTVELVGKVVEVSTPTRLVITWANASQASNQASYSLVTFDIAEYQDISFRWRRRRGRGWGRR